MRQLVDDDRLERLGWGEDEPPRERKPALVRRAPPARPLVADADRRRRDAERPAWCAMSRSIAARARGLSHASRTAAIGRRSPAATWTMISSSSAPPIRSTRDRRTPVRAATSRSRWRSPRKRMTAPSRSPPRASAPPGRAPAARGGDATMVRARRGTTSRGARDRPSHADRVPARSPRHRGPGGSRPAGRANAANDGACTRAGRRPASRPQRSRSRRPCRPARCLAVG